MPRLWDKFSQAEALVGAGAVEVPKPASAADLFWSSYEAQRAINGSMESRAIEFAKPYTAERAKMLERATGIPAAEWELDHFVGPWADDGFGSPARRRSRLLAHIKRGEIDLAADGSIATTTPEAASAAEGNETYAGRLVAYWRAVQADPKIPTDEAIARLMGEDIGAVQRRAAGLSAASPGFAAGAAEFGGGALGGLANVTDDPVGGPALLVGGLWRTGGKTALERIARVSGREGAIGLSTEIPVQVSAFRFNRQVGVPYTYREAAANVVLATLGSAVLGAGIQGTGEGLAALRARLQAAKGVDAQAAADLADLYAKAGVRTPEADQAAATLREVAELEQAAPALDAAQQRAHQAIATKAREDLEAADLPMVDRQVEALRATLPELPVVDRDLPFKRRLTPQDLEAFEPTGLQVDAALFQFKAGGDAAGVTDRLRDVTTFEPAQAGTVLTWENKAGKLFIVDGHQRMGIARRALAAGQDPQTVFLTGYRLREVDGVTPQHARVLAAFKNIGEGTGSAVDVAKIYREAHRDLIHSMPQLSGNNALARDGRNLAKLGDEAFGMVINDVVRPEYGAIVGEILEDAGEQVAAIDVLRRTEPANQGEARAIVEQVRAAGFTRAAERSQGGLFSDEDLAASLFKERAQILQAAKADVRRDLATFRTLTKQEGRIGAAGNKLAKRQNLAKVEEDEQTLTEIDRLANVAGPVSDALGAAARGLAGGELNRGQATAAFVGALRQAADGARGPRAAVGARKPRPPREVLEQIEQHPRLSGAQRKQLADIYAAAIAAQPEFERAMGELAQRLGGRLVMGPLKSVRRAVEKILDEEGGDFTRLKDLVRGTIEVEQIGQVIRAADEIAAMGATGLRNLYAPDAKLWPTHYRDVKANVQIRGAETEIQVNVPEMLQAKEGLAHPLYERQRTLEVKVRNQPSEEDARLLAQLVAEQAAIYDAAFETISRKVASSTGAPLRMADDAGKGLGAGPSKASAVAPSGETATGMPSTSPNVVPGGKGLSDNMGITSAQNDITRRVDLLGDDTAVAQAIADAKAGKDAARNTGQVDLETGDPTDLFSAAREQADMFQAPTAERAVAQANDLVLEDPERVFTLVDEAGVERKIPAAQAFADLDAEEAALRRVALCATPGEA